MTERSLTLEEPCGQFQVLTLPDPVTALVCAAIGVVGATPDSGDRVRLLERLQADDEGAALLAAEILRGALGKEV